MFPSRDTRRPISGVSPFRPGLFHTLARTLAVSAALFLAGPSGSGPAEALADDALTVERIFGSPSLLSDLPTDIGWAGSHKVVYYEKIGSGEESETALIAREVPSGKRRVLCVPDTAAVPEDLREDEDTRMRFEGNLWDKAGRRMVFSFGGDLFTFDAESGRIERRTRTDGEEKDPSFSPEGDRLAYTRDHDLYVLDLEDGAETRLTATGCDSVLNGTLDWVYMEELFTRGDVKAYWWSPDGSHIAFLEIREHPVPLFPLVDWIPVHAEYELQHYPKAGDPNPIVRVGMVSTKGGDVTWADTDTSDDSYFARVYWLGDGRGVALEKLNRAQDLVQLMFATVSNGSIEAVIDETHSTWVNINYLKHYYEKKRQFIWGSERDGHSHLYLFNMDGSLIRQVTSGDWEVISLNGVNESKDRIYFTANEKDVRERHLYEITEKGKKRKRISKREGDHRVTMSPDHKYYIDRYSSHARPVRVAVHEVSGKELFEIGDQRSDELRALQRPLPEFLTLNLDGRDYYCMMTMPEGFDSTQRYPVIVYVYGGPHAQVIRKSWSRHHLWHSMMAQKGYVVFSLDNRGSFGRGKAWEDPVLRNLGHYELVDQLLGVEYLKSQPYVDPERIGVWGWSYGGYMTLLALFKAGEVFEAGVSVAPVSDWHLYDTIYTERYMKRPVDNEEGYFESSPLNFAEDFDGKLLLMHGDADDNVHVQNSIKMVRKLIDAGKDFDFMIYPQKLHGISGSVNRIHLYGKMTRFFDRHLKSQVDLPSMAP